MGVSGRGLEIGDGAGARPLAHPVVHQSHTRCRQPARRPPGGVGRGGSKPLQHVRIVRPQPQADGIRTGENQGPTKHVPAPTEMHAARTLALKHKALSRVAVAVQQGWAGKRAARQSGRRCAELAGAREPVGRMDGEPQRPIDPRCGPPPPPALNSQGDRGPASKEASGGSSNERGTPRGQRRPARAAAIASASAPARGRRNRATAAPPANTVTEHRPCNRHRGSATGGRGGQRQPSPKGSASQERQAAPRTPAPCAASPASAVLGEEVLVPKAQRASGASRVGAALSHGADPAAAHRPLPAGGQHLQAIHDPRLGPSPRRLAAARGGGWVAERQRL